MNVRPRAAFVVTVSMLGSIALAGCGKKGIGESSCQPPDCHMNPPPPPPPPPTTGPISMNPPAVDLSVGPMDAGGKKAADPHDASRR